MFATLYLLEKLLGPFYTTGGEYARAWVQKPGIGGPSVVAACHSQFHGTKPWSCLPPNSQFLNGGYHKVEKIPIDW